MDYLAMYLFSGIVYNDNIVQLPDERFDVFRLREMKKNQEDTIVIFRICVTNINTLSYNTFDTIQIGEGHLQYLNGKYFIIPFNEQAVNLNGYHIIPKHNRLELQKKK
jgi:hypothetical protein